MKHDKLHIEELLKEYASYTFEDFMQDDFFILSVRKPSNDSIWFWNQFIQSKPVNSEEYYRAKSSIDSLSEASPRLTTDEVFTMWRNIEIANKGYLKRSFNRQKFVYLSVAASLIFAVVLFSYLTKKEESSLMKFVEQTKIVEQGETTQLILSDARVIDLEGQKAEVSYQGDTVNFNERKELILNKEEQKERFNQMIVPKGKRAGLSFSDGTKIWINSGTKVIYPSSFNDKKREIYVDGEIFAEVEKDEKRPFIVKTSGFAVEVLGTVFNINAYCTDSEQAVVLVSGAVNILSDKRKVLLKPREKYENDGGIESVRTVDIEPYISWTKGMYIYESERLDLIVKRLSRYYGIEIVCSEEASYLRFSGKLDLKDDLASILSGLEKTAPIELKELNGKYLITLK